MDLKHDFAPDEAASDPADRGSDSGRRGWPPEVVAICAIVIGLWMFALARVLEGSFAG